jgi:hypothetical protein
LLEASLRTVLFAIALSLLLAGPAFFVALVVLPARFWVGSLLPAVGCLLVAMLIVSAAACRSLWRQIGSRIQIYEDRLVYIRKGESVDFRWEDIYEFYCREVDEYHSTLGLDRTYIGSKNYYRVIHRNGPKFAFREYFMRDKRVPIAAFVTEGLPARRLPALRERLLNYEILPFGPLRLEPEGIGYGQSLLQWDEVDFVGIDDGKILVRKKNKTLRWCSVQAGQVPNLCLFLTLTKEKCNQQWSAP